MNNRRKSIDQEEHAAKLIDGERVRGSGSVRWRPGDAMSGEILVECKFTDKESLMIEKKTLTKIEEDALNSDKIPMFMFGFDNGGKIKENWVAFPEYAFERLIKYLILLENK